MLEAYMPAGGKMLRKDGQVAHILDDTNGLVVIATDHHLIHEACVFSAHYRFELASDATGYIQIKTGTKPVHLRPMEFSTDAEKADYVLRSVRR